ncbi:MAG TPA: L-threonylcarbamoyladenylate synthase [Candidatus Paceibacterota bacterium]|nr:L-threonylcarbamoyladenylate synthase [Candidatus Paceibacterota bacterium]
MDKNNLIKKITKELGIAVYPTDTIYGILGSALSKRTVSKIYKIKGRDENKPFIILISKIDDLKLFGIKTSAEQNDFLQSVWPGKVSVILPCKSKKFQYLHRGTKSLAFRLPKKKSLKILLEKTGPLVAPSANPQGLAPATTIREAKKYFGEVVDVYVSGGKLEGKSSTLISLLEKEPRVLRK